MWTNLDLYSSYEGKTLEVHERNCSKEKLVVVAQMSGNDALQMFGCSSF